MKSPLFSFRVLRGKALGYQLKSAMPSLAPIRYDSRMWRIIVRALSVLVLLVALAAGGMYAYLRQSLPVTSGDISVAGITAPVEIVRDADAIPHVIAKTKADALYGLGYVHAQDRLWQMEFQRRIGHGRLSEIFEATIRRILAHDRLRRAARSAWQHLPDDAFSQVNAYLAGERVHRYPSRARCRPGPHSSASSRSPSPGTSSSGQDDGVGPER